MSDDPITKQEKPKDTPWCAYLAGINFTQRHLTEDYHRNDMTLRSRLVEMGNGYFLRISTMPATAEAEAGAEPSVWERMFYIEHFVPMSEDEERFRLIHFNPDYRSKELAGSLGEVTQRIYYALGFDKLSGYLDEVSQWPRHPNANVPLAKDIVEPATYHALRDEMCKPPQQTNEHIATPKPA